MQHATCYSGNCLIDLHQLIVLFSFEDFICCWLLVVGSFLPNQPPHQHPQLSLACFFSHSPALSLIFLSFILFFFDLSFAHLILIHQSNMPSLRLVFLLLTITLVLYLAPIVSGGKGWVFDVANNIMKDEAGNHLSAEEADRYMDLHIKSQEMIQQKFAKQQARANQAMTNGFASQFTMSDNNMDYVGYRDDCYTYGVVQDNITFNDPCWNSYVSTGPCFGAVGLGWMKLSQKMYFSIKGSKNNTFVVASAQYGTPYYTGGLTYDSSYFDTFFAVDTSANSGVMVTFWLSDGVMQPINGYDYIAVSQIFRGDV